MSKNLSKYLHDTMDKQAGIEHAFHRTKIVATVGPACDTYDKLLELVKAGVNVFRLNFSHGNHEDKLKIIEHIRNINNAEPFNISILGDLQGPKLRVGEIENNALPIFLSFSDIVANNPFEKDALLMVPGAGPTTAGINQADMVAAANGVGNPFSRSEQDNRVAKEPRSANGTVPAALRTYKPR